MTEPFIVGNKKCFACGLILFDDKIFLHRNLSGWPKDYITYIMVIHKGCMNHSRSGVFNLISETEANLMAISENYEIHYGRN